MVWYAILEDGERHMNGIRICPKCGSKDYSMVFQGGANSENKPFWECSDCSFKQEEDDKINSFDFDQGYNLDEVYDQ